MDEKEKAPAIRFRGFTDVWERRNVGEILAERNTQAPKSDEYPLMAFVAYEGVTAKGERYNREFLVNDEKNKKYKQTELGDFIYSSNNLETGSIGLNNYGNASISPVYSIFMPVEYTASDFIGQLLIRKDFTNQMVRWRQGVIYGQWRIHESDFIKIEIAVPSVAEQAKIGIFFKHLDNLITLHQRKLEKLKNVKNACLEKMFPKSGENIPGIRFKGFTESWEQCKWIDTVDISTNMVDPRKNIYDNMPHIGPGNIESFTGRLLDNVNSVKEDNLISGKFHFNKGDVIYGKINPQLGKYVYATYEGLTSADAYVLNSRNGLHQSFLFVVLQTQHFFKFSVSVSMRSGMPKINRNELNEYSFMAPSEEEQEQIGRLFLNLDNLITLQQRKIEKLQNVKKACLEKMFV